MSVIQEQLEMLQRRRKRRRQRRIVAIAGFLLMTTGLAWFFESQATTTVIVTRYAESLMAEGSDPGLSAPGERRSRELARLLGNVDVVAGLDAIFVSSTRRSRDTSAAIATLNGAPVHNIEKPGDVKALAAQMLRTFKGKIVLVITEPEYIQPLIAEMQGSKKLPDMASNEHDNIYIVSIPWFGKVKTLRLHYGDRFVPVAAP